jgi:hypothetical protein
MVRMPGRWLTGGCHCRPHDNRSWGPDCAGHESDPRRVRRREQREVREVAERFRGILRELGPQDDEPGALEELVQEIGDWAPLRAEATRVLL